MGFGKFRELLKKRPMYIVGVPNPASVSKEEYDRRVKKLNETNAKIKEKWERNNKLNLV